MSSQQQPKEELRQMLVNEENDGRVTQPVLSPANKECLPVKSLTREEKGDGRINNKDTIYKAQL